MRLNQLRILCEHRNYGVCARLLPCWLSSSASTTGKLRFLCYLKKFTGTKIKSVNKIWLPLRRNRKCAQNAHLCGRLGSDFFLPVIARNPAEKNPRQRPHHESHENAISTTKSQTNLQSTMIILSFFTAQLHVSLVSVQRVRQKI